MNVMKTALPGVLVITPKVHGDARGFFMESYHEAQLLAQGIDCAFIQDNHSLSAQAGTVRGLHYQEAPHAQTKLLRVLTGAVYDVAVDIRPESLHFGQWVGVILTAHNKRQLLIPKGFAHGFCTLVPDTQVLYKVDAYYSPTHDRGIRWNDPAMGIEWPVSAEDAVLSDKDAQLPLLAEAVGK